MLKPEMTLLFKNKKRATFSNTVNRLNRLNENVLSLNRFE